MSLAPPTRPDHPIPSHPQREHGAQTRRAGRTAVSSRPPGMRIRRPSRCGSRPLVSASRKQICFLSSDALLISSPCDPPARSVCAPSPAADRLAHGEDQQVLRPLQDQSHRRRSTGTSLLRPPSPALLRSQAPPPPAPSMPSSGGTPARCPNSRRWIRDCPSMRRSPRQRLRCRTPPSRRTPPHTPTRWRSRRRSVDQI